MGRARDVLRRWRTLPVGVRDAVLAGALTATGQLELVLAEEVEGPRLLQHLAFLLMTGSLALRRSAALAAAVLVSLGLAGQTLLGDAPVASGFIGLFVVGYSVATYEDSRRRSALGLLAILAAVMVYPLVSETSLADEVVNAMIPVSVWLLARLARERLDRAVCAEREAQAQRQAEEERRAEAVAAERRRIARELHDVVAHGVTLMLLQAEVLRGSIDPVPGAREHLDVVQDAGRRCLDDLRTLLVVLRDDGLEGDAAPTDVAGLVERARAAGAAVRLEVADELPPLPPALGVTVYRLLQEALTNAARHAPGAPVEVRLGAHQGQLQVEVVDRGSTGRSGPSAGAPGSRLGLVGARERLALHGGTLEAGPAPDGPGWRVRASLPLPEAVLS